MSNELSLTTTRPSRTTAPPFDPAALERLAQRLKSEGYRVFWEQAEARAWGLHHFWAWFNGLSAAERHGLGDYVKYGYAIGADMRLGSDRSRGFILDIDAMLSEVRTPEAVALTRLWTLFGPCRMLETQFAALRPGDIFTDRAFLSTSIGWTWGLESFFQDGRSRLPSVILVRPGARFLPLWRRWRPNLSKDQLWRHEILLPRDLPLRLLERADENNCYRLIFEALDETAAPPLDLGGDRRDFHALGES